MSTRTEVEKSWDNYDAADAARERLAGIMSIAGRMNALSIFAVVVLSVLLTLATETHFVLWFGAFYLLLVVAGNWLTAHLVSALDVRYAHHASIMRKSVSEIMDRDPGFLEDCFALWLRPFHTDLSIGFISEKTYPTWINMLLPAQFWSTNSFFDINEGIDFSLGQWLPVVAIGEPKYRPDDQLICYLSSTSDTWRPMASRLIELAAAIVIMPDATEGTRWEIQQIWRLDTLGRTVFLMPGENRFAFLDPGEGGKSPFNPRKEWESAQARLLEHRIRLPKYDPLGYFFTVAEVDGELVEQKRWSMSGEATTLEEARRIFELLLQIYSEILEDGPVWRRA